MQNCGIKTNFIKLNSFKATILHFVFCILHPNASKSAKHSFKATILHFAFCILHPNTSKSAKQGFTLLEILLSITIIALITSLIVGFARLANLNARRYQARADITLWQEALQRWHDRFGEFPLPQFSDATHTNGIPVLDLFLHTETIVDIERTFFEQTGATTNATHSNLLLLPLKDPWGTDYRYHLDTPDTCTVWSCGPDSTPRTSDDFHLTP